MLSDAIHSPAAVSREQSAATEEVGATVEEVAAQVEEMSAQMQTVATTAESLRQLVTSFGMDEAAASVATVQSAPHRLAA